MSTPDDHLDFPTLMVLERHGPDTYVGISPRYEWGRLYGGQVVAQALRAAIHTIEPPYVVHSLHAYFIRGGTFEEPVRYEVDRLRNGRSFLTRGVVARQSGGAILNLAASFQVPETEVEVQTAVMPTGVPAPDELEPTGWGFMMDRRTAPPAKGDSHSLGWVRLDDDLGGDPVLHVCGLAFTSDTVQFEAARSAHPRMVPREQYREAFMGASLDHAVWFHRPLDPSEWHLYDFTCHTLTGARGITIGNLFTSDGVHAATIAQEVLLRERRPG